MPVLSNHYLLATVIWNQENISLKVALQGLFFVWIQQKVSAAEGIWSFWFLGVLFPFHHCQFSLAISFLWLVWLLKQCGWWKTKRDQICLKMQNNVSFQYEKILLIWSSDLLCCIAFLLKGLCWVYLAFEKYSLHKDNG